MSKTYLRRLQREHQSLQTDPPPFIFARPDPASILEWHFALIGPADSPYAGGVYHGKILFTREYPNKPPGIMMLTPNGRFEIARRICFSMSDYHPELWNPMWSVSTILTGLLSFMLSDEMTTGGLAKSDAERRALATQSIAFNAKEFKFRKLFPELVDGVPASIQLDTGLVAPSDDSSVASTASTQSTVIALPAPAVASSDASTTDSSTDQTDASTTQTATTPTQPASDDTPTKKMSVKQLKAELQRLNVDFSQCFDKADLIEALNKARQ